MYRNRQLNQMFSRYRKRRKLALDGRSAWLEYGHYRRPYNRLPTVAQPHRNDHSEVYDPRIDYQDDDSPAYDPHRDPQETYDTPRTPPLRVEPGHTHSPIAEDPRLEIEHAIDVLTTGPNGESLDRMDIQPMLDGAEPAPEGGLGESSGADMSEEMFGAMMALHMGSTISESQPLQQDDVGTDAFSGPDLFAIADALFDQAMEHAGQTMAEFQPEEPQPVPIQQPLEQRVQEEWPPPGMFPDPFMMMDPFQMPGPMM